MIKNLQRMYIHRNIFKYFQNFYPIKDRYDLKSANYESRIEIWVAQKVNQRNERLNTDKLLNNKVYHDISKEEKIYSYKKEKAIELMQLQSDSFYRD